MKLICERSGSDVDVKTDGKKFYIEGIFMQTNRENRNKRIYDRKMMEAAVDKFRTERIDTNRAVGELEHPADRPNVDFNNVSHRITEMYWDGDDVIGKALILNTPKGKLVQGLLEGGVKLGVSSRGMGSLVQKEGVDYVGDDFVLETVDIVQDPSAQDAYVNSVCESVDWEFDGKVWRPKQANVNVVETEQSEMSSEQKMKLFETFLSNLNATRS